MSKEAFEVLNKSLESQHKCVQLKFINNARWVFFLHSLPSFDHFSKIDFPDSLTQFDIEGLKLSSSVLSKETLNDLLTFIQAQQWKKVAFRRVQFYGNEHIESSNYIKPTIAMPEIFVKSLEELGLKEFDTITVAEISPGKGIPIALESHLFDDV